jgi:hypothetical protein
MPPDLQFGCPIDGPNSTRKGDRDVVRTASGAQWFDVMLSRLFLDVYVDCRRSESAAGVNAHGRVRVSAGGDPVRKRPR